MSVKFKLIPLEERIVLDAAIAAVVAHPHDVVIGPEVNITKAVGSQGETNILVNPLNHNDLVLTATYGSPPSDLLSSVPPGSLTSAPENNLWISTNGGSMWSEVQIQLPSSDHIVA